MRRSRLMLDVHRLRGSRGESGWLVHEIDFQRVSLLEEYVRSSSRVVTRCEGAPSDHYLGLAVVEPLSGARWGRISSCSLAQGGPRRAQRSAYALRICRFLGSRLRRAWGGWPTVILRLWPGRRTKAAIILALRHASEQSPSRLSPWPRCAAGPPTLEQETRGRSRTATLGPCVRNCPSTRLHQPRSAPPSAAAQRRAAHSHRPLERGRRPRRLRPG
jgi:hypothetical protein